jgi:hypothetical protein
MIASAALLVVALSARPDWVDGMPAAFPRERFLTAVGMADDRGAAEARARAGIASFFESRVAASTQATEAEAHAAGVQKVEVVGIGLEARTELHAASYAARQEVVAVTAKLLEGVEIADAWSDEAGRVHALAVLDRGRAVETLRRRIVEVDAEVAGQAARLAEPGAPLARARAAQRIVAAAGRRAPLVADLRLLDPSAEPEAPAAVRDARTAAERALAAIGVGVSATGDDAPRLRTAAARAIVATGLRVVPVDDAQDLSVRMEEEAAVPAVSGPWTVARLTARVRVLDARKETVGSFVETAKGTSGGAEEAARRAGEALAARVEERLQAELRSRLDAP